MSWCPGATSPQHSLPLLWSACWRRCPLRNRMLRCKRSACSFFGLGMGFGSFSHKFGFACFSSSYQFGKMSQFFDSYVFNYLKKSEQSSHGYLNVPYLPSCRRCLKERKKVFFLLKLVLKLHFCGGLPKKRGQDRLCCMEQSLISTSTGID